MRFISLSRSSHPLSIALVGAMLITGAGNASAEKKETLRKDAVAESAQCETAFKRDAAQCEPYNGAPADYTTKCLDYAYAKRKACILTANSKATIRQPYRPPRDAAPASGGAVAQ